MTAHKVGTREDWQAARAELAKLEAEHAELGRTAAEKRRELPWVAVEKEYVLDTQDGKKTLAELFDGRFAAAGLQRPSRKYAKSDCGENGGDDHP
jgi:predicted dithiol-disulfide oxidoreductase (DUF899 family)